MPRTKLLTVEGMDGAGKGTAITLLQRALQERGEKVIVFREPGSTEVGEKLRSLVTSHDRPNTSAARALLYVASRVELYNTKVKKYLEDGYTVILDRCWMTGLAYSPREDWDWLFNLHEGLGIFDLSSVTFFLDIDYAVHVKRMGNRGKKDAVEEELVEKFDLYRGAYRDIIHQLCPEVNNRTFVIDGSEAIESVFLNIMDAYDEVFDDTQRTVHITRGDAFSQLHAG